MIRVISSFADGPVNFHSTGPAEDQIQKLISSTEGAQCMLHNFKESKIFWPLRSKSLRCRGPPPRNC